MDLWERHRFDPVTLHKYLYANVDPVNRIDPSGMFSLLELSVVQNIMGRLRSINLFNTFKLYWKANTLVKKINLTIAATTVTYAMLNPIRTKNSININIPMSLDLI